MTNDNGYKHVIAFWQKRGVTGRLAIINNVQQAEKNKGGIAVYSVDFEDSLPLPIAGLMSNEDVYAVAEKLGVADKTISKWETGRGLPEVSLMMPLCEVLGITVNELLSGESIGGEKYKEKAEEKRTEEKKQEKTNAQELGKQDKKITNREEIMEMMMAGTRPAL